MLIRTKLLILITFALAITTGVGLILFENIQILSKEAAKQELINQFQTKIFERALIRDEYFLFRHERPLEQFNILSEDIELLLLDLKSLLASPEEQILFKRLAENNALINRTFSQIVGNANTSTLDASNLAEELERRLISQVMIKSQENNALASYLDSASRTMLIESQKRALIFVVISLVTSIIVILATIYLIWYSIARPIIELKEYSKRIGSLDFSLSSKSSVRKDEIGDLVRAFNAMVDALKESYATLEKKVSERTKELLEKTEALSKNTEELKKLNSFMVNREIKMVEMKKEIQKLNKEVEEDKSHHLLS